MKLNELFESKFSNIENKLKNFDWDYEMSDDHRVWQRGRDAYKKLIKELKELVKTEEDKKKIAKLWNAYNPQYKKYKNTDHIPEFLNDENVQFKQYIWPKVDATKSKTYSGKIEKIENGKIYQYNDLTKEIIIHNEDDFVFYKPGEIKVGKRYNIEYNDKKEGKVFLKG